MNIALAEFALNYMSWVLLCLGLPRYYALHFGESVGAVRSRALRILGWAPAALAVFVAVRAWGWGIGMTGWACAWMLAAMTWVLLQPLRPALARTLAPALLIFSALCQLAL